RSIRYCDHQLLTVAGAHASSRSSGKRKPSGITPITWKSTLPRLITRPSAAAGDPHLRLHSECASTITRSARANSASVGVLPNAGATPITRKKFGEVQVYQIISDSAT